MLWDPDRCTSWGRSKSPQIAGCLQETHSFPEKRHELRSSCSWGSKVMQNLNSVQTQRTRNGNARAAISSSFSKTAKFKPGSSGSVKPMSSPVNLSKKRFPVTVISSNAPAPLRILVKLLLNSWSTLTVVVCKFCTHLEFSLKFCLSL